MGHFRDPFQSAPFALAATGLAGPPELPLDAGERALIRSLRPEARARWLATLTSAVCSVLVYWTIWHWPIALGLVLGMWVHELGHLIVLRRLGIERGPIVFVPLLGALQRLRAQPACAADAAKVALAGPAFSLLFASACKLGHLLTDDPALRFLGGAHAILAVIDLMPFGMLDGKRLVEALGVRERAACALACALAALAFQSPLPLPTCLAMAWSASRQAPSSSTRWVALALQSLIAWALCLV